MYCLGIDSAGRTAGAAVFRDEDLLYEVSLATGLTHSETLLELVDQALKACSLKPGDIGFYSVCAGPGSFTGLRIGLALVKGLALPSHTPCAGVSTLEALALTHPYGGITLCALDARRGEVYWAAFENGKRLSPDAAGKAQEAADFAAGLQKPVFCVGDGALLCYNILKERCDARLPHPALRASRAAGICLAGLRMQKNGLLCPPEALMPEYLRLSQAERERKARQSASAEI